MKWFLYKVLVTIRLFNNMDVKDIITNRLEQARTLFNNKEYFNCRLVLDNVRNLYLINHVTDAVLINKLNKLEQLVKDVSN